jgi:hypothetical protein
MIVYRNSLVLNTYPIYIYIYIYIYIFVCVFYCNSCSIMKFYSHKTIIIIVVDFKIRVKEDRSKKGKITQLVHSVKRKSKPCYEVQSLEGVG